MSGIYRCDHTPRCGCAGVAESFHAQLCDTLNDRNALTAKLTAAERERDEAREWVRRLTNEQRTLTCVYCGHAYPPGSPTHGAEVLRAHIRVCPKHPMREAEAALQRVRDGAGAALGRSHAEVERLRALLREVEWKGTDDSDSIYSGCPVCPVCRRGAHAPDCRLAAVLK